MQLIQNTILNIILGFCIQMHLHGFVFLPVLSASLPLRCAVITVTNEHIMTFDCNQMEGRYVSFSNPGPHKIIQFCEVKVYPTLTYGPRGNASLSNDVFSGSCVNVMK